MGLNTYPYNPFPASTDKLDEAHNADLQQEVDQLKSGLTNLDNDVNGDATTYPYADVITIEDAVPSNLADCSVKIEPVQDLHGYDKPWVGGAGIQKLHLDIDTIKSLNTFGTWTGNSYEVNGITYECSVDSYGSILSIKSNGTNNGSDNAVLIFNASATQTFKAGTYSFGLPSNDYNGNVRYRVNDGSWFDVTTTVISKTYENDFTCSFEIAINVGATVNNLMWYPMVCLTSAYDGNFYPYSNICPITGHTEASVELTDGDETTKTYTIALGDTIYGGTVDFDSGVMTVTHGFAEFDGSVDENWTYEYHVSSDNFYTSLQDANPTSSRDEIISNMFTASYSTMWVSSAQNLNVKPNIGISSVNDWKAWLSSNHLHVCYELATPFTIQLTPQQIQLLKGTNTITASTGQISVTVNGVSGSIGAVQTQANDTDAALAELAEQLPTAPTTDGAYVLTVTVASGTPTYSWESAE